MSKVPVYTEVDGVYAYGGDAEPVDVLGTVVDKFKGDTSAPAEGDTIQELFDKLVTFNQHFNINVGAVKLSNLSFDNSKVVDGDTITIAAGKLQGQINKIKDDIPIPYDISMIALQTKLDGLRELPAQDIVASDDIINAFGKLLGTVKMLQSRIEQLEGAK